MRLRTYLFLSNLVSIGAILLSLFLIYQGMLLTWFEVMLLMAVTCIAALISVIVHAIVIRPIVRSVRNLSDSSEKMAQGDFAGEVPQVGPAEFKQLARQFNTMRAQLDHSIRTLRQSEASRKELVANISHDLRTPLASIQSYVEALQDRVITDEETFQRYLHTIQHETTRLSQLINDLFQLSRLDADAIAFQPVPYPIDTLIVDTLQSQSFLLESKGLNILTSIPDNLPPVQVMPFEIQRVLNNLLHNAIQYSPEEGCIQITAESLGSWIAIAVRDEGEGINLAEQERIFDRFYRMDKSRNRRSGGAGLGLAICKSILELHGGTITVESGKGGGSIFRITLPTAQEAAVI